MPTKLSWLKMKRTGKKKKRSWRFLETVIPQYQLLGQCNSITSIARSFALQSFYSNFCTDISYLNTNGECFKCKFATNHLINLTKRETREWWTWRKKKDLSTQDISHSRENKWGKPTSPFHLGFFTPEYAVPWIQLCVGLLIGHIFNTEPRLPRSDNFSFRPLHLLRVSVSSTWNLLPRLACLGL